MWSCFLLQRGSLRGPMLFSVVDTHPNERRARRHCRSAGAKPRGGSDRRLGGDAATRDELEQRLERRWRSEPAEARRGARWSIAAANSLIYLCLFSRCITVLRRSGRGNCVAGEDGKAPAKAVLVRFRVWVKSRQQAAGYPVTASSQLLLVSRSLQESQGPARLFIQIQLLDFSGGSLYCSHLGPVPPAPCGLVEGPYDVPRSASTAENRRIDSWKEIAAFSAGTNAPSNAGKKNVASRPSPPRERGGVFAWSHELTSWLNSSGKRQSR